MAVKDDLDICLNITTNFGDSEKQGSKFNKEAHVKRLKKKPYEKLKKSAKKFQSDEASKKPQIDPKNRVKPKFLAALVEKNLLKAKLKSGEIQVKSILKNPDTALKQTSTEVEKNKSNTENKVNFSKNEIESPKPAVSFSKPGPALKQTNTKVGKNKLITENKVSFSKNEIESSKSAVSFSKPGPALKQTNIKVGKNKSITENKVSFSKNESESSKPAVSFSQPTKNSEGQVLFAKKRDNAEGAKKSLASIFKAPESADKNITNSNETASQQKDSNVRNEEKNPQPNKRKFEANKATNEGKKFKKSNDKIEKNKKDLKKNNTGQQQSHRQGKHSSLFHNNPDIPNIGQRLVKPVNEKVFTAEKFSDLNLHAYSVSNLEQNMEIKTMTTVQKKAIPVILTGQDVLIRSQTGSGKTLAYALPIIEALQSIRPKLTRDCGTKALVVVPTRELALQSYECFLKLIKPFTWIVPGYLVGGEKRKAEKARLRKGCTILVTTPGRLLDHIRHTKALKLDGIKYFVLDEADRMLDMGYEKDISEIVSALKSSQSESSNSGYNALQLLRQQMKSKNTDDTKNESANNGKNDSDEEKNIDEQSNKDEDETTENADEINKSEENNSETSEPKRQTILLSATLTHAVEKLAGLTMKDPVLVDAAKDNVEAAGGDLTELNDDLVVPQSVNLSYVVTPPKLRMVTLSAYIAAKCQNQGDHKILVFMATQDMVDYHTDILSTVLTKPQDEDDDDSDPLVDVEFFKLHGSMSQKERTEVFKTFRQTNSGVLLCTDVAARGLDLPKVDLVIQYTGPTSLRDYVHRIGRTARAGSSGTAIIFLTPPEVEFVRMLEARRIRIKQDDMNVVLGGLVSPLYAHLSVQHTASGLQNEFESLVLEDKKFYTAACKAYTSWIRFYSSYPREMREVFNRKNLHLGHYAKSFALRDPPQKIGSTRKVMREREEAAEQNSKPKHENRLNHKRFEAIQQRKQQEQKDGVSFRQQDRRNNMFKQSRMLNCSEHDSGLEPLKKSKKH